MKCSLILFTTLQRTLTVLPASQVSRCSALPVAQTSLEPVRTLLWALVRRPGDYESMGCLCIYVLVCLFLYVFVCVSVGASVSLTSYSCLYVSLCMFICVCLFFPCVCLSVCVVVDGVYVSVTICLRMHLCVYACIHVQYWEHPLGWPSEGEAYRSMCTCQSSAWINGTQLSAPW